MMSSPTAHASLGPTLATDRRFFVTPDIAVVHPAPPQRTTYPLLPTAQRSPLGASHMLLSGWWSSGATSLVHLVPSKCKSSGPGSLPTTNTSSADPPMIATFPGTADPNVSIGNCVHATPLK